MDPAIEDLLQTTDCYLDEVLQNVTLTEDQRKVINAAWELVCEIREEQFPT